jgi:hypothetical protein
MAKFTAHMVKAEGAASRKEIERRTLAAYRQSIGKTAMPTTRREAHAQGKLCDYEGCRPCYGGF